MTSCLLSVNMERNWCRTTGRTPAVRTTCAVSVLPAQQQPLRRLPLPKHSLSGNSTRTATKALFLNIFLCVCVRLRVCVCVSYRVRSRPLRVRRSVLQRRPDSDRRQGRGQLLPCSHLQSVPEKYTFLPLIIVAFFVLWCCVSTVCSSCPEVPPICLQGEVLTVEANTTDRCCPSYQCGQNTQTINACIYLYKPET